MKCWGSVHAVESTCKQSGYSVEIGNYQTELVVGCRERSSKECIGKRYN